MASAALKTALTNVRVFDGQRLTDPTTVVIDDGTIGTDANGARTLDAGGAVLLPGLIDAHVHLHGPEFLDQLAARGVTTALDMANSPEQLAVLRDVPGTTSVLSAGTPVIGPGGPHSRMPGMAGDAVIHDVAHADRYVADRIAAGSDYLKIILEAPGEGGPEAATATALVAAAHARGIRVIAHAASHGAFTMALDAGADIVTHIPLGTPLDPTAVQRMSSEGHISVPTLTMMEGTATARGDEKAFAGSLASVAALHRAGVPVLAGTDANTQPGVPFQVPHGTSLHHELQLLVTAGLTPAEALRAATSLPARHFGLTDRGAIAPGLRADLVLVDGDPLADIRATRALTRVWCGGVEHPVADA
ncbi:amidohydrolase family protein [Streptomyces noursei]|uniref:Amidohydrolase n=1 Tax=Streptomyces noursei TaxID=1971 RepID=A0A2N8PPV4_STRNR|nr:amidohydrolase family protein [Streptomyces noursei]PNE43055.1 amidohydrolase [Streptomyces noursei]